MKIISFEDLYSTKFSIDDPFFDPQNWYTHGNFYSCIGKPKNSHTFLWFRNCSAMIKDNQGHVLRTEKDQIVYMAKGLEYSVEFFDTQPDQVDSIVAHFQLRDETGQDILACNKPMVCLKSTDVAMRLDLERIAEESLKSLACVPEMYAVMYRLIATICKKRHTSAARHKFAYIYEGIELLEGNTDKSIEEIAQICGVSEGYFRRLFKEYSGDSPMDFRQKRRVEKAKQMLLSNMFTIGEIAQTLHFNDIYHFSKTFKKFVGTPPRQYIINASQQATQKD